MNLDITLLFKSEFKDNHYKQSIMDKKMELADKLLLLRKDKNWTQAVAAKNIAIQQSYLSKLENGHYQPSQEVIEKLCRAYHVKEKYLCVPSKKKHQKTFFLLLISIIGVVLIITGHFSLIFPQTYYTYKTQPLVQVHKAQLSLDYHLSDSYQGDKYIQVFSGIKYEYTLIAEKEIDRLENRWLIIIGLVLLLLPMSIFSFFLIKKRLS